MKILKTLFILIIGSCFTFLVFDYTLGKKEKNAPRFSTDETELAKVGLAKSQLIAMQSANSVAKSTDFYQNTFQPNPDSNGSPVLKHGKRFYNQELMDEIATSANLETFSRDND